MPFRLLLLLLLLSGADAAATCYIVYLNPTLKPSPYATHLHWHHAHLDSLSLDPSRHLLYSYTTAAPSAFAAHLLPSHVAALRSHPAVAFVREDALLSLHTTRSPSFLHLPPPADDEDGDLDVIVGVLDTGVWPESPSFGDAGLGPVPARWRGSCETTCNQKLIGSRSFLRAAGGDGNSNGSRDHDGHGTHTASTAAGAAVAGASLFGYASGTARGMAPAGARVAAYKVCRRQGCYSSDVLAGMEQAINDGVDVLSLSLGGGGALALSRDPIAVGALAATRRGIVVACSTGNGGPSPSSVVNTAPWVITVGAGTLDRSFPAYAELGNGETHASMSLCSSGDDGGLGEDNKFPLVYGQGVRAGSKQCMAGTLDAAAVKGKVVLCDRGGNSRVEKGQVVKQAGAVGMVLANTAQSEDAVADCHLLPAVAVSTKSGDSIRRYVGSEGSNAEVALTFAGTVLDVRPAPVVAAFSSRGPNRQVAQLLKPDVIGPGVNILAGWTGSLGPTGLTADDRQSPFNILSGTSMSCPHISGLAAFVKAAHPDWSPSAIKSAFMTTTYTMDNTGSSLLDAATNSTATPWSFGAGHVDPVRALSPGLVYDASADDYLSFLCTVGVSPQQIQAISNATSCTRRLSSPGDLNYPSFSIVFSRRSSRGSAAVSYRRKLTNVGDAGATYTVKVTGPSDVSVTVNPSSLMFRRAGDKQGYTVTFQSANAASRGTPAAFGWLTWSSDEHDVRSPISYRWGL